MVTHARIIGLATLVFITFAFVPASSQIRLPRSTADSEYFIPEAWRERTRQLVEPGPRGLPGDLALKKLELGKQIIVTYEGSAGVLKVLVSPAKKAPADAVWKGERLALSLVNSSLTDEIRGESLKKLQELLQRRESGWGWLRRPSTRSGEGAEINETYKALMGLRRQVWTGESNDAIAPELDKQMSSDLRDLAVSLRATRVAHRMGDKERSMKFATMAREQGIRAASSQGLKPEMLARVRISLANASAYSRLVEETQKVVDVVLEAGVGVCRLARTVTAFRETGQLKAAQTLTNTILKKAPSCAHVSAQRVEVAVQKGDVVRARNLVARSREIHKSSLHVLAAEVRVGLAAGEPDKALKPATVLARQGMGKGEGFAMLMAVAAHGRVDEAEVERWMGLAARYPDLPGPLQMGLVACLVRKDASCALARLEQLGKAGVQARGLGAAHALALAWSEKLGEANQHLDSSWETDHSGIADVAAQAEIRTLEGDTDAATRTWTAYLKQLSSDGPGPVTEAEAQSRLAALKGGGSSSSDPVDAPAPAGGPDGGVPPWIWWLAGIPVLAFAFKRMRGGSTEDLPPTSGS